MVRNGLSGEVPPSERGYLEGHGKSEVLQPLQVADGIGNDAITVYREYLGKIIVGDAVSEAGDEQVFIAVAQLQVPGILGAVEGIAFLVRVFVDDEYERVEGLESRAIDPSACTERESMSGIRGVGGKKGREQAVIAARERGVFYNGISQLVGNG